MFLEEQIFYFEGKRVFNSGSCCTFHSFPIEDSWTGFVDKSATNLKLRPQQNSSNQSKEILLIEE